MIRISRLTDYSIVLLTHVARGGVDRIHNARDLASEAELPLPTVSKLLKTLTKTGFLESHRGVQGGYALARPPESITMVEIISALEGPVAITLCSEGPGSCELEHQCPTRSNLVIINRAIRGALEGIRLSDLAAPRPLQLVNIGVRARPAAADVNLGGSA